jgi:hypothetical protein
LTEQFEKDVQAEMYRLRVTAEARRRLQEEEPPEASSDLMDKVVELVERYPAGVSRNFVETSVPGARRAITLALEAAVEQDRIRKVEGGPIRGQTWTYRPLDLEEES